MMNLNAFTMKNVLVHERGQIKEIIFFFFIALSVQSQVKLVKLVYIETQTCKVTLSLFLKHYLLILQFFSTSDL